MTSKRHTRASDRCAEALIKIEKRRKIKFDIVVMVQGDEPMTTSFMINQSLKPFKKDKSIKVVNLFSKFENLKEFVNPNTIKVVRIRMIMQFILQEIWIKDIFTLKVKK